MSMELERLKNQVHNLLRIALLEQDTATYYGNAGNLNARAWKYVREINLAYDLYFTQLGQTNHLLEEKRNTMPNAVTFSDESTIVKAMTAISGDGKIGFQETLAIVKRIQDAGLLFREPRNEEDDKPRAPRKKNADGTETVTPESTSAPRSTVPEGYTFTG